MQMSDGKMSDGLILQLQKVIVPIVEETVNAALRAHEASTEEDGKNFCKTYSFGCVCWENLFNRLQDAFEGTQLEKGDPFEIVDRKKKCIELKCMNGGEQISFYIAKAPGDCFVPKNGRAIKRVVQKQCYLSEELQRKDEHRGVYVLVYDADLFLGLEQVSFSLLTSADGKCFESRPLHVFNKNTAKSVAQPVAPEHIQTPTVKRQVPVLATEQMDDKTALG